jgi:hypothetical protein
MSTFPNQTPNHCNSIQIRLYMYINYIVRHGQLLGWSIQHTATYDYIYRYIDIMYHCMMLLMWRFLHLY